jgi:hypothetical protein
MNYQSVLDHSTPWCELSEWMCCHSAPLSPDIFAFIATAFVFFLTFIVVAVHYDQGGLANTHKKADKQDTMTHAAWVKSFFVLLNRQGTSRQQSTF